MEDSITDIRNMEAVLGVIILTFVVTIVWLRRKARKKK